jgi:hypothetical protein
MMRIFSRRRAISTITAMAGVLLTKASFAQTSSQLSQDVLRDWYRLLLELVRHTATFSPPVASRAFAYIGITAYEAVASGDARLKTFAGQLNGLGPLPARNVASAYNEAVVLQAALAHAVAALFANTGPTGQRALAAMTASLKAKAANGVPEIEATGSEDYGVALANHILEWAQSDGGAVIENMGFPYEYTLSEGPAHWVPTNLNRQQQLPLLPNWGKNRPFVLRDGADCALPPPPEYSEDPASAFYKEALEVIEVKKNLTDEQKAIARFWSDDPMLSPTPPGHWISIALQIINRDAVPLDRSVEVLALVGIAVADGFIGCWSAKYKYDLLRPLTYIRRVFDKKWEALLITPPFPEYPSGHSTQSGAAATVLTHLLGANFAFTDATHEDDGLAPRDFPSFWAAAEEAGISRLFGGIHFRAAVERGLDQGRCIGTKITALKTRSV